MSVFREDVVRIELENNYKIFADRNKLRIFMKEGCELNMLTRNSLFGMRDQLNIYRSWDEGLTLKVKNSLKLREDLNRYGISTIFRRYRNSEVGYFYSTKSTIK